jgi:hypothetical protein
MDEELSAQAEQIKVIVSGLVTWVERRKLTRGV